MDITQRFERCIVGSSPAGANERSEIDNSRTRTDCHTAIRGFRHKRNESCWGKNKRQRTAYGLWITPDRKCPIMTKSYPH